jgi:hypothetical protein
LPPALDPIHADQVFHVTLVDGRVVAWRVLYSEDET